MENMSQYEVREIGAVPVLYAVASCKHAEIGKMIGEALAAVGRVAGAAIAGPPFARYTEWTDDACTIEIGMPVNAAISATDNVLSGELGGCLAVCSVHIGPYDTLAASHEASMRWIREQQGLRIAGDPWESYVMDSGDEPDSSKWMTEIYWPVKRG